MSAPTVDDALSPAPVRATEPRARSLQAEAEDLRSHLMFMVGLARGLLAQIEGISDDHRASVLEAIDNVRRRALPDGERP